MRSLQDLLKPDGTLNLSAGYSGNLDPTGWVLDSGPNETPRFVAANAGKSEASALSPLVAGDEYWDRSFATRGANASIFAMAVSGNKLYVGGSFVSIAGKAASRIAMWDGEQWLPLGSGADMTVYALAVDGDNLYAGGEFFSAGGVIANQIARWDGSQWHNLGPGVGNHVNPAVYAIAVAGGYVHIGGRFTAMGQLATKNLARWDGSNWSHIGGTGTDYEVYVMTAVGSDVYAGGRFNYVRNAGGGLVGSHIAKWNGTEWSGLDGGVDGGQYTAVMAIASLGGSIYVGGEFTTAGDTPAANIARWDGTQWSALGSGTDQDVYSLTTLGSDLYAGGIFTTTGGVSANRVAKWDGAQWLSLGSGIGDRTSASVRALAALNGTIYAGGSFVKAGDQGVDHIAKWQASQWSPIHSGNGSRMEVHAVAVSPNNGEMYAGGQFITGDGQTETANIGKWNGSQWSSLGVGLQGTYYPPVRSIAISGTDVYAGGYISTTTTGMPIHRIGHWDGTQWHEMDGGMTGGGDPYGGPSVLAIAISGTHVYAGGYFVSAGGATVNNIAMWDGAQWLALGVGVEGPVRAIAIKDGNVYVGGGFTSAGGQLVNYIAMWDGAQWSAVGDGILEGVHSLVVSGDDLYAGGPGGVDVWNGTQWTDLGLPGLVNSLTVSMGKVYATGQFVVEGGAPADGVAVWDGSNWQAMGAGLGPHGGGVAIASWGNKIYVSGSFWWAGNKPSFGIALWHDPGASTCTVQFEDAPPGSTFYDPAHCLACAGILSGYACGGPGEPCVAPSNYPYLRVNNNVTRGQISKIVALAANFSDPVTTQTFEDVAPGSTFYTYVGQLAGRGVISGYACGGAGEPCIAPDNRPYFRPNSNTTRGQLAKVVCRAYECAGVVSGQTFEDVSPDSTFYQDIEHLFALGAIGGYACGGAGEPCVPPGNRSYFRPGNNVTRGQTGKIVANAFYPDCQPAAR